MAFWKRVKPGTPEATQMILEEKTKKEAAGGIKQVQLALEKAKRDAASKMKQIQVAAANKLAAIRQMSIVRKKQIDIAKVKKQPTKI